MFFKALKSFIPTFSVLAVVKIGLSFAKFLFLNMEHFESDLRETTKSNRFIDPRGTLNLSIFYCFDAWTS